MNGLVIAGGSSTRMGFDKSQINYHGMPQVEYIYNMLNKYCRQTFISYKTGIESLHPIIVDNNKYNKAGAMAALLTAYEFQHTDWLIVAIDYPFFDEINLNKLLQTKNETAVFYNRETSFYEPFLGLYKAAFYNILNLAFENEIYSLQKILKQNKVLQITPMEVKNIKSIDTPHEYQEIINKI